ncbi:hypothetical protein KCP75_24205 [Salmonella enterica subsp. enterica]|nr:hypothetical protein KCP75_24205 [Salmonella enterica subsp. enterica]
MLAAIKPEPVFMRYDITGDSRHAGPAHRQRARGFQLDSLISRRGITYLMRLCLVR